LYMAFLLALLYGWQPWMFFTYGMMGVTLIWVLYRDVTGHPVTPLLDYSAQFTALKFVITAFLLVFALRYVSTFYRGLLETYQNFAGEQIRLNDELKMREQALEQSNRSLIQSRQAIVTVREEERRKLRRDLHDGVGPTLAAQVFRVGVAQQVATQNPQKAAEMLIDVEFGIRGTLTDIRELAYGLRPPLLDQLGLLGALSDIAKQQEGRVAVRLDLPSDLTNVSAAVEVAMFRIVQTAIDNVTKHAQATCCAIQLKLAEQSITLSIVDDGIGIADRHIPGVGLTSMQERAEELGGLFRVRSVHPHGTLVQVTIPLPDEHPSKTAV
ncbi:MAG: sensor histidine kinase, partial [Oscillochloris sp.]|nr:sensor histidine kinase [Oscillochloris sp.]